MRTSLFYEQQNMDIDEICVSLFTNNNIFNLRTTYCKENIDNHRSLPNRSFQHLQNRFKMSIANRIIKKKDTNMSSVDKRMGDSITCGHLLKPQSLEEFDIMPITAP